MWSQFDRLKLVEGPLCREYELESGSTKFLQLCLPRKIVPKILELVHALLELGPINRLIGYDTDNRLPLTIIGSSKTTILLIYVTLFLNFFNTHERASFFKLVCLRSPTPA